MPEDRRARDLDPGHGGAHRRRKAPMSTSETRTDTPAARVPAPRRADRGERWTERLGWEESPDRESRVSRG
ncbi:hypothetical protein GCM10009629_08480 [Pseudonocardia alni]